MCIQKLRVPFFAVACVALLAGCGPESAPVTSEAVADAPAARRGFRLFDGGTVVTMEAEQPSAEAVVADAQGRIAFVGGRAAAHGRYPGAERVDLEGRTLLPGLIEQHLHPFLAALALAIPVIAPEPWELPDRTWPAVTGHEAYLAALAAVERDMHDPEEILWTWGFHQYFHGPLSREMLDAISDTRPIGVWHRSAHEFYLNTPFVERFGLSQQAIDGAGAEVAAQADLERGHFFEAGALLYLLPVIFPELGTPERFRAGLVQMVEMLHRNGVTAYNEPGAYIPENAVPIYQEILGADSTPMYSFFIPESKTPFHRYGVDGVLAEVERIARTFGDGETAKVRFLRDHIKLLVDGAIISQLMQVKDGYRDGHHGEWIQPPEEVDAITEIFWKAGYQIHAHVNGDLGLEALIAILQKRQQEHPREDHRFTIVHFANSTEQQVRELAELGVLISANPYYVTGFGEKFAEIGLGAERAHAMARLGSAEAAGISISLHSDMPMAPANPLYLAWSAVTRKTRAGKALRPDLALSRDAALRAITIDAAYSWGMEDSLGSIEVGKIANFTILEENPYEVEPDRLKDIAVHATVFEGRLFPVKQ